MKFTILPLFTLLTFSLFANFKEEGLATILESYQDLSGLTSKISNELAEKYSDKTDVFETILEIQSDLNQTYIESLSLLIENDLQLFDKVQKFLNKGLSAEKARIANEINFLRVKIVDLANAFPENALASDLITHLDGISMDNLARVIDASFYVSSGLIDFAKFPELRGLSEVNIREKVNQEMISELVLNKVGFEDFEDALYSYYNGVVDGNKDRILQGVQDPFITEFLPKIRKDIEGASTYEYFFLKAFGIGQNHCELIRDLFDEKVLPKNDFEEMLSEIFKEYKKNRDEDIFDF